MSRNYKIVKNNHEDQKKEYPFILFLYEDMLDDNPKSYPYKDKILAKEAGEIFIKRKDYFKFSL